MSIYNLHKSMHLVCIHLSFHLFMYPFIYSSLYPSILSISYHPSSHSFIHLCMHVLFPAHKLQCSIEEVEEGRDNLRLQLDELNRYNWRIHVINSLPRRLLLSHIHHHRYLFNHIHCSWLFLSQSISSYWSKQWTSHILHSIHSQLIYNYIISQAIQGR